MSTMITNNNSTSEVVISLDEKYSLHPGVFDSEHCGGLRWVI
jgi:hypothetical protein